MTLASGAIANYTYDAASQLTSLVHSLSGTTIGSLNYTYDAVGNRTAMTEVAGTNIYAYDTLNRLTQATHPQPTNPAETFTYDPVGNRTSSHVAAGQVHDAANRLLEDSNFTYTYDANGNLTSKTSKANGEVTTYTYDAENQLIRVDRPGVVAEYRYDALGRRIEKVVNGVSTRYIYDKEDIAAEVDSAAVVQAFYLHGPGIDEPLAMGRFGAGGGTSVFHADGLGSITHLTNTTGAVVRSYTYDSFGRLVAQTGTFSNPYTYTGRELDPESGLYYYRARHYDPTIGRFLQEDPIHFAGGDLNLYGFVRNDPVNLVDPKGLSSAGVGWVIKLTQKGFKKIRKLFSPAEARQARRQGENVLARNQQTAKAIEQGISEGEEVLRHKGHRLPDGSRGRPHYQTRGLPGHTFWSVVAFIGSLLDPFSAISGELSPDDMEEDPTMGRFLINVDSSEFCGEGLNSQ